jgi:hypothetical protein
MSAHDHGVNVPLYSGIFPLIKEKKSVTLEFQEKKARSQSHNSTMRYMIAKIVYPIGF